MSRTAAREIALTLLYELSYNIAQPADIIALRLTDAAAEAYAEEIPAYGKLNDNDKMYITSVLNRASLRADEFDDIIAEYSRGWETGRISRMTRAILHLALAEINDAPDVPRGAAIDQAVTLAKRYDDDGAPAYINGILGSYVRGLPAK